MSVQNGAYTRTYAFGQDPSRPHARFHMEENPPIDPVASEKEGRAVHLAPREMIELIMPGSLHMPDFYVTEEHKQQYPEQYAAFKRGEEIAVDGIPLEDWPRMTRSQIKELKHLDFCTVEQVANMSDTVAQRLGMGGMNLRELAKAFLDDAQANALTERLAAEGARKDAQIAELSNKVDELSALLTRTHNDLQTLKNAPSPIAVHVPGQSDPVELAKVNPSPSSGSSFDSVQMPKRRGRPSREGKAA